MDRETIIADLGLVLSGESLERLLAEADDPLAHLTAGEAWRVGQALRAIADRLESYAKGSMVGITAPQVEAGVMFTFHAPSVSRQVDVGKVREIFPDNEDNRTLYKESKRRGYVAAKRVEVLP